MNTQNVAKAMAEVMDEMFKKVDEIRWRSLAKYDLVFLKRKIPPFPLT